MLNLIKSEKSWAISYEEAIKYLPDSDKIHIERPVDNSLVTMGCHIDKNILLQMMKQYQPIRISGENMMKQNHGLVIIDNLSPLFIETRSDMKVESTEETETILLKLIDQLQRKINAIKNLLPGRDALMCRNILAIIERE